jgi:hypothetical protein
MPSLLIWNRANKESSMIMFGFFLACLLGLCPGYAAFFAHDLHVTAMDGSNARTLLCLHGYGANYRIIEEIQAKGLTESKLIGFNFPDHDLYSRELRAEEFSFGTIQELVPALYVLKTCVQEKDLEAIDLYGYSAGGGALVNAIAVLHSSDYDEDLEKIGIGKREKSQLLAAIQKGVILLDVPLKSVEEIVDFRGPSYELDIVARNYRVNHFRPIDALDAMRGLSLHIIVYFEERDEVLSNRDDEIYMDRLRTANQLGRTEIIIGNAGGHCVPHHPLWQRYESRLWEKSRD